jgi:hypothetical protein
VGGVEAVESSRVAVVALSQRGRCEDGGRLLPGAHPKAIVHSVFVGVVCCWGGRVGGSGRKKFLVDGGGHSVSEVLDAVFLLGGDAEVYPPSLLPLRPSEILNLRVGRRRLSGIVFLLGDATLGRRKVVVLRVCPALRLRLLSCLLQRSSS